MPFGLKNAEATYQRLVNQMFAKQIGQTIKVYVDDMLIKSVRAFDHLSDLEETFSILREYRMKLNSAKCVFEGQAVAEFITEFTVSSDDAKTEAASATPPVPSPTKDLESERRWVLYVNRSSNAKQAAVGIVMVVPDSTTIQYAIRLGFRSSNNEAKYEALLIRLGLAARLGVQTLEVQCDSQLVVNHIFTEYEAKEAKMVAYLAEAQKLIERFWSCTINQILRVENSWADTL
ncbi:uncharacterized protein LOC131249731 [Magnolia sinica]|uniref:uncharacterized protein LOC131249731 n=1 Tax=Magnolia sinica TaxID=86752 RepID=UPI0026597E4C|nr:uncharacterized protein LOC131249731 [Magnolia sinica]